MKIFIIASIVASITATSALSQGLVNFSAGVLPTTRMSTNSIYGGPATGITAGGGPSYYFALFATSSSTVASGVGAESGYQPGYVFNNIGAVNSAWELVGMGSNSLTAGRMGSMSQGTNSAGQGAINGDGSMTVQGIAGGSTAYLVTLGWSASLGSTYEDLANWYNYGVGTPYFVWYGQSAVAAIILGDNTGDLTSNPFGTGPGQVGGILLGEDAFVPEPGTWSLAAAGATTLLLLGARTRQSAIRKT